RQCLVRSLGRCSNLVHPLLRFRNGSFPFQHRATSLELVEIFDELIVHLLHLQAVRLCQFKCLRELCLLLCQCRFSFQEFSCIVIVTGFKSFHCVVLHFFDIGFAFIPLSFGTPLLCHNRRCFGFHLSKVSFQIPQIL